MAMEDSAGPSRDLDGFGMPMSNVENATKKRPSCLRSARFVIQKNMVMRAVCQ